MSMSVSSQDQSFQLFSCKWAWCRSTFSNNAGLVHHVVHDHVCRAIPVRRRDIPMIRRAEEGKGESLKISELMLDIYSYSSRESIPHRSGPSAEPRQEPSSSLPSPPASSSASHSPHHIWHSPEPAPSLSPPPFEHREKLILRSPNDISCQTSPHFTSSKPLQESSPPPNQITTFASLSSPESERRHFSFEIPDSPSFSSLVERPNKRKMTPSVTDSMSRNKIHANQSHSLLLSDLDLRYRSLLPQVPEISIPSFELIHEHDNCRKEVQWESLLPAEECMTSDPASQSQSDGHHHLENLPVMSQPPSQLRLDSEFPFHFHDRPRGSTSNVPHTVHTGLDPNASTPLSPVSPASSPIFAVSTPVRQNWYQPPLKRSKRSSDNDKDSDPSTSKVEASVFQTKSRKKFCSGTLHITPASLLVESMAKHTTIDDLPMDINSDANRQNNLATPHHPYDSEIFSQSSQDSADLSEINSYPALQTQAPYQSQSLTQF